MYVNLKVKENITSGNMAEVKRKINKKLVSAIINCNVYQAEQALTSGADPNLHNRKGIPLLNVSIMKRSIDCVKVLLKHKVDINKYSMHDCPEFHPSIKKSSLQAIHIATIMGYKECQKLLLEHGASVNALSSENVTPLHIAAHNGDVECVSFLLDSGAELENKCSSGYTPLGIAVAEGQLNMARFLIEKGANIQTEDGSGLYLIHTAIIGSNDDRTMAELLLSHGENPNQSHKSGGISCLEMAVLEGHINICKMLLEYGADINRQNRRGATALHSAAQQGFANIVDFLIKNGASVNATATLSNATPLHMAALHGHADCMEVLVKAGADPTIFSGNGVTAMHIITEICMPLCLVRMIKLGVSIELRDIFGFTPLSRACIAKNMICTAILIEKGAKINDKKNRYKMSPLHLAATLHTSVDDLLSKFSMKPGKKLKELKTKHIHIVEYLLPRGGSVNSSSSLGTPLHIAAREGNMEMIKLLIDNNANINAVTPEKETVLFVAAKNGQFEVVKYLLLSGAHMWD